MFGLSEPTATKCAAMCNHARSRFAQGARPSQVARELERMTHSSIYLIIVMCELTGCGLKEAKGMGAYFPPRTPTEDDMFDREYDAIRARFRLGDAP